MHTYTDKISKQKTVSTSESNNAQTTNKTFTDKRIQSQKATQLQTIADHYSNQHQPTLQKKASPELGRRASPELGRKESKVQNEANIVSESNLAPVQRMKFDYINDDVKESKVVKEKLAQVIPVLRKVVAQFGSKDATVKFKLIDEGGMSPAFSNRDNYKEKDKVTGKDVYKYTGDVLITLNQWYAERASVGDILGMLSHELGVHAMADFHMGLKVNKDKDLIADKSSEFMQERGEETKKHTGLSKLKNGPHTLLPIDRNDKNDRRQEDHVNIGKGLMTGKINSRAHIYLQTFLKAGDAITDKDSNVKNPTQQLFDLIQSYLFDVARIVATDDGKPWAMFSKTEAIAEVMNFYQDDVLKGYQKDHPWLTDKQLQVMVTGGGLRKRLLGLLGELLKSSNPTVQKGRAITGGGLLAAGLYGFGAATALPALGIGALAGLGIWGASKLWGY